MFLGSIECETQHIENNNSIFSEIFASLFSTWSIVSISSFLLFCLVLLLFLDTFAYVINRKDAHFLLPMLCIWIKPVWYINWNSQRLTTQHIRPDESQRAKSAKITLRNNLYYLFSSGKMLHLSETTINNFLFAVKSRKWNARHAFL